MPDWSQPSTLEATSVHHGYATAKAPELSGSWSNPRTAADGPVAQIVKGWYAKLEPGGFILPHTDAGPWVERWHYPIDGQGFVWQEWEDYRSEPAALVFGVAAEIASISEPTPYRMNHHRPHAVWNPFAYPRIILIVEYDNPVDQPTRDLEVFDPLPEMKALVEAAMQPV